MPAPKAFIDTNVLLYLLSEDMNKADQAEEIVQMGFLISVQVLNEMPNENMKQFGETILL